MLRVVCRRCGTGLARLETTLDDPRLRTLESLIGGLEPYLWPDPADDVVRVAVVCDGCLASLSGADDLVQ